MNKTKSMVLDVEIFRYFIINFHLIIALKKCCFGIYPKNGMLCLEGLGITGLRKSQLKNNGH